MANYEQGKPESEIKPNEVDKPADDESLLMGWEELRDAPNMVAWFLRGPEAEDAGGDYDQAVDDVEREARAKAGSKYLSGLAEQACRDFDRGWTSSEEYRAMRRDNYRMLTGLLPKKTFPFPGCANVHAPVMLERQMRLAAHVFSELFLDRETIFAVDPTGPDDVMDAEVLTLHGNWQLRNEFPDFLFQMEMALGEFFGAGSVFCHSYRDTARARNRHDVLNCEELVFPYVWTTVMTDMSDVPWKARVIRKYRHELQALQAADDGEKWEQLTDVLSGNPPGWDMLDTRNRELSAKREGIVAPESDPNAPYIFLEYHGWARMPGSARLEPVCMVVEKERKIVCKLYLRDEEDWRDRERYNRQEQELKSYQEDADGFARETQLRGDLQMRLSDPASAAVLAPEEAMAMAQALEAEPPVEPTPPTWLAEGNGQIKPVRRVPIESFSHGRCWHNPNGALGLSFGQILGDLNRLVDEAGNRFYDSATLANVWSALVGSDFQLEGGGKSLAVQPGKIIRVKNMSSDQLKNAVHELRSAPGNPQLMDIMRMATDWADAAVAAPGVLSGEPGKSGETFRGLATRREQATKQLTATATRFLSFLDQILRNNAKLNSVFMPDDELVQVGNHYLDARVATMGEDGQPQTNIQLGRALYRRNYRVTFTADVRFTSQAQRIAERDEALAMANQIPHLASNNWYMYAVIKEALSARGLTDLVQAMGPPPKGQPPPFGATLAPPPPEGAPGMTPPPGAPGAPEAGPPMGPPPGGPQ